MAKYALRTWANPTNPMNDRLTGIEAPVALQDEPPRSPKLKVRRSIANKVVELAREYGIGSSLVWQETTPRFPPWEVRNIRPCDDIIRQPKNSMPDFAIKKIYTNHMESHVKDEYNIYTDGSKTSDGVAFAMVGR